MSLLAQTAAATALAAAMPPAPAAGPVVEIPAKRFAPAEVNVAPGDTVTWTNRDFFTHDLHADDGSFASSRLFGGASFVHTFTTPGTYVYHCSLHPFMIGQVNVFAFSLHGPVRPTPVGGRAVLHGVAPQGARSVAIERRAADGAYQALGTAVPTANGEFEFAVVPSGPTVYRAVAGEAASLPLVLPVSARIDVGVRQLAGGRVAVRATASPAQPGVRVALERYVRLRFDYWAINRTRLDQTSAVTFRLRPRRTLRVRVALESGRDGYAPGGVSRELTIRARNAR